MSSNGKHEIDPAPSHTEPPRERVEQWLHNVSMLSCDQLRKLRDQIDDQIRAIQAERDRIKEDLHSHADWCQQVIDCERIIIDTMAKLINPRLVDLPELPKGRMATNKEAEAEADRFLTKYAPKQ